MIQDFSLFYTLFRPTVRCAFRCHYDHIAVRGLENLPKDGPYIIAPCHQNALMEPLAVLYAMRKPVVFLARADIFAKPLLRKIFTALKIMPVYRIRDGRESLSKNEGIFEACKSVLLSGTPLCLMAEGRHTDKHQLLPLVKGMFRIAGETQMALGEKPLYIVPTGIDFDEYERPYSDSVVSFGKPIAVQPFMKDFIENEPIALNAMRDTLANALKKEMHHIETKEYYEDVLTASVVFNKDYREKHQMMNLCWNRFVARKAISQSYESADESALQNLAKEMESVRERCRMAGVRPVEWAEKWPLWQLIIAVLLLVDTIVLIALCPWLTWGVVYGLLCFPIAVVPTHLITKKLIKDPQFRSSVNFGIRFGFSLIYLPILALILGIVHGWYWFFITVGTAYLVGRLCGPTTNWLKKIWANILILIRSGK